MADMTAMYYGDCPPPQVRGKHDIDSESYLLAETLHRVAVLGGSAKDIADTALLVVANSVMDEMVVSTTDAVLTSVAEAHNASADDAFAKYLMDRAKATLTGMAYVGAYRSIAWMLSRHCPSRVRVEAIQFARIEHRRVGARTGYASLVADDAHAHLRTAERIAVPDDPELRQQRVEAAQVCAATGCRLLAMAFALASGEAWNPFVAHRLSAELNEHSEMLDAVASFSPLDRTHLDIAHQELTDHWSEAASTWHDLVSQGRHDIDAYFKVRLGAPAGLLDPSSTTVTLRNDESEFRRLV